MRRCHNMQISWLFQSVKQSTDPSALQLLVVCSRAVCLMPLAHCNKLNADFWLHATHVPPGQRIMFWLAARLRGEPRHRRPWESVSAWVFVYETQCVYVCVCVWVAINRCEMNSQTPTCVTVWLQATAKNIKLVLVNSPSWTNETENSQ